MPNSAITSEQSDSKSMSYDGDSQNNQILFLLKGYPRLSETFIAQEIHALESLGLDIVIASLRKPTDKKRHPVHEKIKAPLLYLPEYLLHQLWRVIKAWLLVRKYPKYSKLMTIWKQDFARDKSISRIRRLGQAMVLAAEIPNNVKKIHSHFIHTPTSVARYCSILINIPFSMSAHAKDIWTIPEWEVVEKLKDGLWLSTCTDFNRRHLQALCDKNNLDPRKVNLDYHGLNLTVFNDKSDAAFNNNGQVVKQSAIVQLISVGRAVPKKGYDRLLMALSQLNTQSDWHFTHIGGGERLAILKQKAEELNISEKITWLGSQSQGEIINQLRQSDIFLLLSEVVENGDRDGLPNVIMEAQSQSLPVIATNISGIPEIIEHNRNGLLIASSDLSEVVEAITQLVDNQEKRMELGRNGREVVHRKFNHLETIQPLYEKHLSDLKRLS